MISSDVIIDLQKENATLKLKLKEANDRIQKLEDFKKEILSRVNAES